MRIYFLCFLLSSQQAFGQAKVFKELASYIRPGFQLLDSASGDLDRDRYPDLVLILRRKEEEQEPEANRPLLLLSGNEKGRYALIAANDSVVLCQACGGVFGDPYQGITIKNGYFSIEHYGGSSWRWTKIITFKYDTKTAQFRLHRDAGESFHTSDPNKVTPILSNKEDFGKLPFTRYSYDKGH